MKKIILFTAGIIIIFGCVVLNRPKGCTPMNTARYFLTSLGRQADADNPATLKWVIGTLGIKNVRNTGYQSVYYGTPICSYETEHDEIDGGCYIYNPTLESYIYFKCP